jgi:histidine triad (HIT) family protein
MSHDPDCLFCKLVDGKIPSRKVYEDDEILVFHDIAPWAPVHLLLIPKRHITSMADVTEADAPLLGRMMAMIPKLMRDSGVTNGFRVIVNSGKDGMQEVPHLHFHSIGGPRPWAKG